MKQNFTGWQAAQIFFILAAAVCLVLCIATDLNDALFLPVALGCSIINGILQLIGKQK